MIFNVFKISSSSPSLYKKGTFDNTPEQFITGSFGGYFSEDLSLFSLLTNRIKGLFIAIAMLSMAYLIFNLG